jgi:SAM-dependent methyltransferase
LKFPAEDGVINFAPDIPESSHFAQPGRAQRYMENPDFIQPYLRYKRSTFVKIMGSSWGTHFNSNFERQQIRNFISSAKGVVLDLACGPGHLTTMVNDALGSEKVIGLDLSFPMLRAARQMLPKTLLVRGSALSLPVRNASLGGILCWNALQLFPRPERVIEEVSRTLQRGGTFECFTYRKSARPYRVVQRSWELIMQSVAAFDETVLLSWLLGADLKVSRSLRINSILLISASKSS